ncbi:glutaredoxin [Enterococcus phage vB_EfaS_Ef6.1]|nr:glutaredoxin [Enterococcus phage vB_EfaS_Ef6.1]
MTKRKLQELGVNYKEINVDENLEALEFLMECGFRSLPVVFNEYGAPMVIGGYAPNILEACVSQDDSKRVSDSK